MKSIKYIFSFILFAFAFSFNANAQSTEAPPKVENIESFDIKVKGVGCADDIRMITENVEKIEGVSSFKIIKKGATTRFQVFLLPSLVSLEAVHEAIEDAPGCTDPNSRPYKVKK